MKTIKDIIYWIAAILLIMVILLGPAMLVCCVWLEGDLYPKIAMTYTIIVLSCVYLDYIFKWASKYK